MIEIREATPEDFELLLPLVLDLERHYEGDRAIGPAEGRAALAYALRPEAPGATLIALDYGPEAAKAPAQPTAVGLATLYAMWPGKDLAPTCFLKELYVASSARGRGVGERLIREAGRRAAEIGAERLDLTTGGDNDGAQRFYERVGASRAPDVIYRFRGAALARLAEE